MKIITHKGITPRIHPSAFVAEGACLIGDVEVCEGTSIWFNVVLRADLNRIVIGKRTNIQDGTIFHVTAEYPVIIGEDVTVGHNAIIHASAVGDSCLIGMGSILLDNSRVESNAVVAAGAVVRNGYVVPSKTLVAGIPATIIRDLTEQEIQSIKQSALNYIEYAESYHSQNIADLPS